MITFLWSLCLDYPILITFLFLYLTMSLSHHLFHLRFKLQGPSKGQGLVLQDETIRLRYRIEYTESNPKAPLVIFESHLGMSLEVWSHVQRQLQDKMSTLSYDRLGVAWSSLLKDKIRTPEAMAQDLIQILLALKIIVETKDTIQLQRKLVFVRHLYFFLNEHQD
jgi:hypothetical protein